MVIEDVDRLAFRLSNSPQRSVFCSDEWRVKEWESGFLMAYRPTNGDEVANWRATHYYRASLLQDEVAIRLSEDTDRELHRGEKNSDQSHTLDIADEVCDESVQPPVSRPPAGD